MLHRLFVAGAVSGFLAVALGAFGAHALSGQLAPHASEIYRTASQYHFVHTLAVLAGALLPAAGGHARLAATACLCWLGGIVIFSGSLYLLAVTDSGWLGAITPVGGLGLLAGWLLLALAVVRREPG